MITNYIQYNNRTGIFFFNCTILKFPMAPKSLVLIVEFHQNVLYKM